MNAIDGTDRRIVADEETPPSLLAVVLDTNPHAWAHLSSTLPLSRAIANLLVFINAHLASGNANEVAVIASHLNKAEWLYPTPKSRLSNRAPNGDIEMNGTHREGGSVPDNPNKYRPFSVIESAILKNVASLMDQTSEKNLKATPTTLIGGALSLALSYIAKSTLLHSPVESMSHENPLAHLADAELRTQRTPLASRILIISVSGDLANQYIPVMNSIFAAQRKRIPIDILKLAGDTVLLQQASDATGGVYMKPERPEGILQYLMMGFLPDATARRSLIMPSAGGVDFRAACFCHRKVVDIGYVCSVCLSIFCEPSLPDNLCMTCGSYLSLRSAQTATPALVQRKKKKKKRATGADSATPGGSTPAGSGTPMHA
ncbi:RNA polymerase II transcription factor-like protein B subunit 4 [Aaosphaeria arxii CBS 175.79]|uniref:General transcription and DNA repair factor IIH subunit TFB4 n=1 Tax=Aaosphaeria arxii CBS 175.79 TaxID=1450172 RepID=A0A6A5Y0X0_9PLEO|nr:RNA polymerase II transcription factor-like protein B subunit 4 [Aaosphaeria arxii CBS 175.79]KAF2018899.1 RNA polymerase II transcription factor-like protein B subunit 4 [Aaosphaeria arxii CBS 175.79]